MALDFILYCQKKETMKSKLDCILLIDDDEATNFLHTLVINEAEVTNTVVAKTSGQAALDYLNSCKENNDKRPQLVFLDINMPAMNGWEFLEHYKKLPKEVQGDVVVVMLTTSLNPDDLEKASSEREVTSFLNKPLKKEMVLELVEHHFPNLF